MKSLLRLLPFLASATALCGQPAAPANANDPVRLDPVEASAVRDRLPAPSLITGSTLPSTAGITAQEISETVNAVDTEDAVKYLPSVFLRKRNYGDTQAVMATRVWGVSSSARSLIFADGVPLSALIANNNNIGGPRWGLVAPAEIERIDVMYGPFSAAYPGNSMGAVMEISTRLPTKPEAAFTQTFAWQGFDLYGTKATYGTSQTSAIAGERSGGFSFWASANHQNSRSQPLAYVTGSVFPAGTTGGYAANNKLGLPANILGASGLLHTRMTNAKAKLAYDFSPALRAAYSFGYWKNDADSSVDSYLRDGTGQPTFAGLAGFATGTSNQVQEHSAHSLSLRTSTRGNWDFEADVSSFRMDKDRLRTPVAASASGTTFGSAGRVAVLGGTGWSNLNLKGLWRPSGPGGSHTVTFGLHDDRYKLYNPTFNTTDWISEAPHASVATEGDGKTRTQAIWAQDSWQLSQQVNLTTGIRYEEWRAYDGYNVNGATVVRQPTLNATRFSPKAALGWTLSPAWVATASVGRAYRFATAAELYQLVSTGTTFTSPDPNLKPDNVLAAELRLEHPFRQGAARISLFQDDVHDAILSQFNTLVPGSSTLFSYISNVDHVRARGIELSLEKIALPVSGMDFSGSITYLNARTLAASGRASATAAPGAAIGRRLPNIPEWRATFLATWHPTRRWSASLGGRYSGMLFTTLDNADLNPNTFQGFAAWFAVDVRATHRIDERWSASLGVDNLLNRKYFLFHPFPQRTVVAEARFAF